MTSDGWVKSYRKITEWEWYTTPNMFHFFSHLILKANHKNNHWKGIEIKRGQLITGRDKLSFETGLSVRQIRTCLQRLKETGELTIKTTNKYSIITICNYDKYQIQETTNDQQNDQQTTSKRPANDHKQEYKNEKNEKNKETHIPEFLGESLWKRFLNHRKNVKAPISNDSWESFFKKFNNLKEQGYNPEFVLDTMIEKGWRWFKPEWVKKNGITEDDKRAASYFLSDLGKNSDE